MEPLKADHRLILIDARGHGESDKPHDPAQYDLELRVNDVVSVLDDLGIDKAHFLGYSMGGRIGFGIAIHAPERVNALIIGGMHPYETGGTTSRSERVKLLSQGMEAYVVNTESQSGPIEPERRARLLANDPQALIASISASGGTSGLVLSSMKMPCLLYAGEADGFFDGASEAAKHIPGAKFVSFPGLDHGQVSQGSDVVLPHVIEFLQYVTEQVPISD